MGDKTARWVFLLGITLSFPILLFVIAAVMGVFSRPQVSHRQTYHPSPQVVTKKPSAAAAHDRSSAASPPPSVPERTPPSAAALVDVPPPPPPASQAVHLDAETAQELAALKRGYHERIDQLRHYRDAEIATLAGGLAQLPPDTAAQIVSGLDDELLARALAQMQPAPRRALLAAFPTRRSQHIRRLLRRSPSR